MNLVFFASRSVSARNNARFFSASAFSPKIGAAAAAPSFPTFRAKSASTDPRPVAVWSVNPDTGRVECRWTTDGDEIAEWLSRPWIERAGLILAAVQPSRGAGSFR
ncbi:hypothetical protein K32_09650 [Kaistia sp. 32K]|uniref:hypothetical protein n=1 Tax=Kaistia sp. 32K TaxID=2795690 RepID=UPI001915FA66|nr:hypothetical protein [Kaistia sp. 32K]BCP52348.1 hypothetical protein K32_09650 [Kaistia sp. 32K]